MLKNHCQVTLTYIRFDVVNVTVTIVVSVTVTSTTSLT